MHYHLIDQSSSPLSLSDIEKLRGTLTVYMNSCVSPHWGGDYLVTAGGPALSEEVNAYIVDTLPDAPGALGYHTIPAVIYIARSLCSSTFGDVGDPTASLLTCLSHEFAETAVDYFCNLWADDFTGNEHAFEVCDPVQGSLFPIGGLPVANFVLPAYFQPVLAGGTIEGPYSYCGVIGPEPVTGPFRIPSGGYQVVRTAGTGEQQVLGEIPKNLTEKKAHWSSRTTRRLRRNLAT